MDGNTLQYVHFMDSSFIYSSSYGGNIHILFPVAGIQYWLH